jgi:hypothetical protein
MEPRAKYTHSSWLPNMTSDFPGFLGCGKAWARSAERRSCSSLAPVIVFAYRLGFSQGLLRTLANPLESGEIHSSTFAAVHGRFPWCQGRSQRLWGSVPLTKTSAAVWSLVPDQRLSPFAIFAGNPARFIRDRYTPAVRDLIAQTRWWDFLLSTLQVAAGDLLYRPIGASDIEELNSRLERTGATH